MRLDGVGGAFFWVGLGGGERLVAIFLGEGGLSGCVGVKGRLEVKEVVDVGGVFFEKRGYALYIGTCRF